MLRLLAIAVSNNISCLCPKSSSRNVGILPPYVTPKICFRRMHFLFQQRDRAISTPQFQDCFPPSCPQFNSISASLLLRFGSFFTLFHSSLLVSSSTNTQLQLCCAGKSPLLLVSLNRSSKHSPTRYQSKLAKRPILTASITSAVRSSPFPLFPGPAPDPCYNSFYSAAVMF